MSREWGGGQAGQEHGEKPGGGPKLQGTQGCGPGAPFHPSGQLGRPGWAHDAKRTEPQRHESSCGQNLGLLEQNKKEPVAVQGPGTTAIKSKSICEDSELSWQPQRRPHGDGSRGGA